MICRSERLKIQLHLQHQPTQKWYSEVFIYSRHLPMGSEMPHPMIAPHCFGRAHGVLYTSLLTRPWLRNPGPVHTANSAEIHLVLKDIFTLSWEETKAKNCCRECTEFRSTTTNAKGLPRIFRTPKQKEQRKRRH